AGATAALFVLGNYLYTSPKVLNLPRQEQGVVSPIEVGGLLVYDLTATRPEGSPDIAWFYLLTVADSITIPVDDPLEHTGRFLLARQLYPLVTDYSEQLAERYRASLERSAAQIPVDLTSESPQLLPPVALNPETFRHGRAPLNDGIGLAVFHASWSIGRFAEA